MAFKKKEIIEAIKQALRPKDYLYNKCDFVNYSGKVEGGKELYTEVVAEYLLKHPEFLNDINELKRERSYKVIHDTEKRKNESNRREELFAASLNGKSLVNLGKVIDFQIPLKPAKKGYDGVGKIDLLSVANGGSRAYIVELKYGENPDTLIKAVLEIAYYYRWLWKDKFLTDFKKELRGIRTSDIKKAVLLGKDTRSFKEVKDPGERPNLTRLIANLKVDIFSIDDSMNVKPVPI